MDPHKSSINGPFSKDMLNNQKGYQRWYTQIDAWLAKLKNMFQLLRPCNALQTSWRHTSSGLRKRYAFSGPSFPHSPTAHILFYPARVYQLQRSRGVTGNQSCPGVYLGNAESWAPGPALATWCRVRSHTSGRGPAWPLTFYLQNLDAEVFWETATFIFQPSGNMQSSSFETV